VAAVADAVEAGHAVTMAADRLAVDDAGTGAQTGEGFHDRREAIGEVVAWAAVAANALAVLARDCRGTAQRSLT